MLIVATASLKAARARVFFISIYMCEGFAAAARVVHYVIGVARALGSIVSSTSVAANELKRGVSCGAREPTRRVCGRPLALVEGAARGHGQMMWVGGMCRLFSGYAHPVANTARMALNAPPK